MSGDRLATGFRLAPALVLALLLAGCASLMSSAAERMAGDLATALKNQNDPETVRSALPAYLLLLDALLVGDPGNAALHRSAARLNAAYAGVFVDAPGRRAEMARKAFALAQRGWCLEFAPACGLHARPFEEFRDAIAGWGVGRVGPLYDFGVVWAGYIEHNSDDWRAVAQIPKVAAIMRRVVALAPGWEQGGAELYLGVIESLVPPALGGHPERARAHFERAIELSGGDNLMASVLLAERYARAMFDRALHDRLLEAVLAAPAERPGLTLTNVIARARAQALLASADDYF